MLINTQTFGAANWFLANRIWHPQDPQELALAAIPRCLQTVGVQTDWVTDATACSFTEMHLQCSQAAAEKNKCSNPLSLKHGSPKCRALLVSQQTQLRHVFHDGIRCKHLVYKITWSRICIEHITLILVCKYLCMCPTVTALKEQAHGNKSLYSSIS